MICKVKKTLCRFSMLNGATEIIVGFSGGADSTCLLYILNSLKDEFNLKIHAVHINHCLRGEESDRDENFVRDFCDKNSIMLSVLRADVLNEAKKAGQSVEEYARNLRYDYFQSLSTETSKIATAHNLNDCEETMIFNLARGSGLKGLCSIPAVRGNIIRPLIECTRDEIEIFCKENNLQYVTDSTNLTDDYTRNKIRHNIIPLLKELNPSFDTSFLRCVTALREDEFFLEKETEKFYNSINLDFGFDADVLSRADNALKNRVIAKIIYDKCKSLPEMKHIEMVVSILSGGKAEIISGETIVVRRGILYFLSDLVCKNFTEEKIIFSGNVWKNDFVKLELNNECTQKIYKDMVLSTLDWDKINGSLFLRKRHDGDKITLPVRKVTKSLKKLFNEMKIIPETRDSLIVLADETSVVWVEGIGADSRVVPDKNTRKFINISMVD